MIDLRDVRVTAKHSGNVINERQLLVRWLGVELSISVNLADIVAEEREGYIKSVYLRLEDICKNLVKGSIDQFVLDNPGWNK